MFACLKTRVALALAFFAATTRVVSHDSHIHGAESHTFTDDLRTKFLVAHQTGANRPVAPAWFETPSSHVATKPAPARPWSTVPQRQPVILLASSALNPTGLGFGEGIASFISPAGNGTLMTASFSPFKPRVRLYNDGTYFYVEGDNVPDPAIMPAPMVGITAWQQQIPLPVSYFFGTTNPENNVGSLGYGQPNVWRLPLVPTPASSPISLNGNFLRGAVAVAANGIAIFNPRNNRGEFSYAIGELDQYGGHCGLADDYHYHIAPVHLQSVLGVDKPVAWALDGYPIYGFTEPDGTVQQALDADGGHDIGNGWGYHYHARGSVAGGHVAPYLMDAMHGQVVNFGGQVDPQPEVQSMRASGTGGYTAQAVAGAVITAYLNPVAFTVDGSGHFVHDSAGTPSPDQYLMRYTVGATTYDICWRINRNMNPKTLTITFRHPTTGTTTTTYTNGTNNRLKTYPMAAWSMAKLPDTGATQDGSATFGDDADYTINPPSFTDNGDGTITDNVTGLMWQKIDNGESTWDAAVTNAAGVTTGGHTDWRLPTPTESFAILNHANNPAIDLTYFPSHPAGAAEYWWTSDIFGTDATRVWCTNSGGGIGAHPKTETLSAGGTHRFHARYVRGAKPANGHNYLNNNDGTITDLDTGLMWTQVPSSALSWNAALAYAEGLTTAGFSDWRLPNVKELQTLVDITLATSVSAATAQACLQRRLFPLATATAYWSSTPLRNGGGAPTQAWLVEFGVNTAATPPRNSQGIVSYEPFTSTYPVFAVRTTSVTTQIAVEQPAGTALTDGVSTVSWGNVNVGSTATKTFTIQNSGSTSLAIAGATIDGTNAANFTVTTPPATSVAAGESTTFVVQFDASAPGNKVAALHIASSDTAVGATFDITLVGTGYIAAPAITNMVAAPSVPSDADTPTISATVTPSSPATLSTVEVSYNVGAQVTQTVFSETMASVPTPSGAGGWDQGTSPATYAWDLVFANGNGNIKQTNTANHTASGQGGTCGLEFSKGSTTNANSVTTTNAINTTGSSGYVEFWVATSNLISGEGWTFQLSTDGGATWAAATTGQLTELTGSNHAFQLYHYNLLATERVANLKIRFNFFGNGVGTGGASKVQIDDIVVVTTTSAPPTVLTMSGPAGGGTFTSPVLPSQMVGTTVSYTISATDSNGSTSMETGSYTTGPAPTITTGGTLPNATGGIYSQTLVASGGTGPSYTWSVNPGSTLPQGLTLSSAGILSGTPNIAGTYTFTFRVTDSAGRISTKDFTLTVAVAMPPNIVIIVTDDQGWGDVGYHTPAGQVPIQTPNMDSFATSGIRLERFYATAVCSVTRSTLLTGRNAIRHGTNNERGLDLSEHLLPQTFKAAGYQTFMCGKWHLGGSDKNLYHYNVNGIPVRVIKEGLQYAPHNRGWDSFYGQYSGAIDYFTHHSAEAESLDIPDWWLNGVQQDGASEHTDSQGNGGWSPDLLADKAIAHIQNRDPSKPMLLHVAFNSIHGPVSAPPALINKYQNLGITDPNRCLIAAAVDGMDQAMGRVLAALDVAGISNNTLVIWFGDNGGDETKGSLNDPLRGSKGDSYDGGIHEPAGIRWPGVIPAGVVSKQPIWVGDVFPTLCAATGVTPQNTKPFDGVNLWPALQAASNSTTVSRGTPLVTVSATPIAIYQFTDPVNGGVKDFKLIRNKVGTTVVNELFNLTDDPYETTDLIANGAYASIVTTLTNAITAITVENMKPYVGPPLITNTVAQGGTITLYAPFTSYPGAAPTVQWRKDGANVAGGVVTQITDSASVAVKGTYATTLLLTNISPADAGTYDVIVSNNVGSTTSDAGTLSVTSGGPTISNVTTGPTVPTFLDDVWVTAQVAAQPGAALSQVRLTYDNGVPVSTAVFSETMRTAAASPWTGDGCDHVWTVSAVTANNVRQSTAANHVPTGNPCGLEFARGTANLADTMVTTTDPIHATGAAGYVEFWVDTSNVIAGQGWAMLLSTDGGATWPTTPQLSELNGSVHGFQKFRYDLTAPERVSGLKLRFQFAGNGVSGTGSSKVQIDDVIVATSALPPPVTVTMYDDGLHGDGAAGDGVFGAAVPKQLGGVIVNYSITATDSNGTANTSTTGSYTTGYTLTDATFTSSEFLGIPTRSSVMLNMEAVNEIQFYVEYGPASGNYTKQTPVATYPAGVPFEFKIQASAGQPPLVEDTHYHYRVRYRAPGETTWKSRGDRSFQTQRKRGQMFTFTITADPHLDDVTNPDLFLLAMRNIAADHPDFHMDLGDIFMTDKLTQFIPGLVVNSQAIVNRAVNLRGFFGEFCHSTPFFYTNGNHEAEYGYLHNADTSVAKDNNFASWNLRARKLYYPTPVPSTLPDRFYTGSDETKLVFGIQEKLENYYAWEWGDALFIVLDPFWNTLSNPTQAGNWAWSLGKPQYDWLKQTLETSSARFKFVFIHHLVGGIASARGGVETAHRYEWGGKNLDGVTDGFAANRPGWAMPIHQLLVANKVNAVFHGHDHFYAYQQLDGIVYQECPQPGTPNFNTGSQADGEYTTGTILPNSGHLRITVSPENTQVEYIRAATPELETATVHNLDIAHTYTMTPTRFPEIVAPQRVGNDALIVWDALRGQDYTLQWSTDLVNWTSVPVGQTNNWTDTGAFNGSTPKKFYRVTK